jgi:1-acyl-sn-glycerol-3-phosphate acyltransferase
VGDRPWRRRLRSIPRTIALGAFLWLSWPALLLVAGVTDSIRFLVSRVPFVTTRLLLFGMFYGMAEICGMVALGMVWLVAGRDRARLVDLTYRVQGRWVSALFGAACVIFDLRFTVRGDAQTKPGPILLFMHHASIVDTLLPTVFVSNRHGIRLRFVLKRELLALPCLDIAGNRLPNTFVRRSGDDSGAELAEVRKLAEHLSEHEGVLIYPEGTRFTPAKLARSLAKLGEVDPHRYERVAAQSHTMPVRRGGPLAILAGAPEADVVIAAHRGLAGFAELGDIWRGGMVGRRPEIMFWRIPRSEVPQGEDAQLKFLDTAWARVDAFAAGAELLPASQPGLLRKS